jgi:hypothetical protein
MARMAAAFRTTGAGSATLPMASLLGANAGGLWLVEVGVTNTTVTAFEVSLKRFSAGAGTPGTAQTVLYEENDVGFTARGDPRDTHTVTVTTLAAGEVRRASIGASIGSGVIWTFGGRGLFIPAAATGGVALMPMTGTGQISDVYWSWDA